MSGALEIEQTAIRLLAAREHSRYELQRKLNQRYSNEETIEVTLNRLEQNGLLSDERFAELYVTQRIDKGYGSLRIRQELQERGISADLIEVCLDISASEWQTVLREAVERKFDPDVPQEQRGQAKRARFLQGRGFPEAMIRHYLWD